VTIYRTGNHWGVTVVRESDCDWGPEAQGRREALRRPDAFGGEGLTMRPVSRPASNLTG